MLGPLGDFDGLGMALLGGATDVHGAWWEAACLSLSRLGGESLVQGGVSTFWPRGNKCGIVGFF